MKLIKFAKPMMFGVRYFDTIVHLPMDYLNGYIATNAMGQCVVYKGKPVFNKNYGIWDDSTSSECYYVGKFDLEDTQPIDTLVSIRDHGVEKFL